MQVEHEPSALMASVLSSGALRLLKASLTGCLHGRSLLLWQAEGHCNEGMLSAKHSRAATLSTSCRLGKRRAIKASDGSPTDAADMAMQDGEQGM